MAALIGLDQLDGTDPAGQAEAMRAMTADGTGSFSAVGNFPHEADGCSSCVSGDGRWSE